jgi:cell division protein FtsW
MAIAMAILLRIDFEMRVDGIQAINKGSANKATKSAALKRVKDEVVDVIEGVIDSTPTGKSSRGVSHD